MGGKDTLVGAPEPDDGRTPEEKYADHQAGIRREEAGEQRRQQEFVAAAELGPEAVLDYIRNQSQTDGGE